MYTAETDLVAGILGIVSPVSYWHMITVAYLTSMVENVVRSSLQKDDLISSYEPELSGEVINCLMCPRREYYVSLSVSVPRDMLYFRSLVTRTLAELVSYWIGIICRTLRWLSLLICTTYLLLSSSIANVNVLSVIFATSHKCIPLCCVPHFLLRR